MKNREIDHVSDKFNIIPKNRRETRQTNEIAHNLDGDHGEKNLFIFLICLSKQILALCSLLIDLWMIFWTLAQTGFLA